VRGGLSGCASRNASPSADTPLNASAPGSGESFGPKREIRCRNNYTAKPVLSRSQCDLRYRSVQKHEGEAMPLPSFIPSEDCPKPTPSMPSIVAADRPNNIGMPAAGATAGPFMAGVIGSGPQFSCWIRIPLSPGISMQAIRSLGLAR